MVIRIQHTEQGHNIWWIIIIVLVVCLTVANGDLLLKPENSCAKDGDPAHVILKCNSTLGYRLSWLIKTSWSSKKLPIFNGYRLSKNVTSYCKVINGAPGKYNLNLTATKNAAHQYVCLEPGTMIEASAELIIIESDPECNVTTDDEFATFTCHIRFHGNWAPAMEWTMDNGKVISEGVNDTSDGESITSRLAVPITRNHTDRINYTCTTKFRVQEKPSDTTADNIPRYNYPWTSSNYIAEPQKGVGDDAKKDENEANGAEAKLGKPEAAAAAAAAAASVIIITVIAATGLTVYYRRRKRTAAKKDKISVEEEAKFM